MKNFDNKERFNKTIVEEKQKSKFGVIVFLIVVIVLLIIISMNLWKTDKSSEEIDKEITEEETSVETTYPESETIPPAGSGFGGGGGSGVKPGGGQ